MDGWRISNVTTAESSYVEDIFSKLGDYSRRNHVPVVVVHLALKPVPHAKLQDTVISNGMRFLDVSSLFEGKKLMKHTIFPIDSHPNAKAHKMFADRIYEFLEKRELLPAASGV